MDAQAKIKVIEGNVTTPIGFSATGAFIGLKKAKKDLALITCATPCVAAGCFTTNIVKAAPVLWDMEVVHGGGGVRGIAINSGNANACTGQKGIDDTKQMAECFGGCIGAAANEILICSTGVIGVGLPMDIVIEGIKNTVPKLADDADSGVLAAQAIMTTDTFMKTIAVEMELSGGTAYMGAMAKGSGMIHPDMATMLSFVTTDAAISKEMLQKALSESVIGTYNMISVDGDTSTNDTILLLASGQAGNMPIQTVDEDYEIFKAALDIVNKKLAVDLARDGEGATKLMEVTVTGAKTEQDAVKIAKSVISSNLFKAALFGEDSNFGRALCAMGYSGGQFDPFGVDLVCRSEKGSMQWMENGTAMVVDEEKAAEILSEKDIFIDIKLREGDGHATAWGCDLTYDYVKINGDYRS